MPQALSPELFWLTLSAAMTGLMWMPYVLNRMAEHGIWGALKNPEPDVAARAPWAIRAQAAHVNAVENLIVFAALALAVVVAGRANALTAQAATIYFAARVVHYLVYVAGVPVARTLAFAVGFAAQMVLALVLLGLL
jgi:uncharacterized MAPEG superfamily protein